MAKFAKDLTLDEAKDAVKNLVGIINELLNSIEAIFPNRGYGVLASQLDSLNVKVQSCNGAFLDNQTVDNIIDWLLRTFTGMHPNIEQNLKDLFEAHKEIAQFLDKNKTAFDYNTLNFDTTVIERMKEANKLSNLIMPQLKKNNYSDITGLNALLLSHSSRVETSVKALLEELTEYRDKINQYATSNGIPYTAKFEPVKIMGVRGVVLRKNGKYYTQATAIRHLIAHQHFMINQNPCTIHFKSPNDQSWEFVYDKTFTCEDFFNFVAEVDLFCKTAVNLLFTIQLLGVLRQKFVVNI